MVRGVEVSPPVYVHEDSVVVGIKSAAAILCILADMSGVHQYLESGHP